MNKFAKGSLAAGAGLVLLLGGAGTLASWNDSAELTGGTINAGTLTLEADQAELDQSFQSQSAAWAPGNERSYSTTLTLTTEGTDIQGTIALDESSLLTGAAADEFAIDTSFDMDSASITGAGELGVTTDGDLTFTGSGVYEIPVTVTVELPFDTATNDSQNVEVTVSDMSFLATQTPVDAAAAAPAV